MVQEGLLVQGSLDIRKNRTKWWALLCLSFSFYKFSFKYGRLGAGEMAQWARTLLPMREDMGSNPRTHKNMGVATHKLDPSTRGWRWRFTGTC